MPILEDEAHCPMSQRKSLTNVGLPVNSREHESLSISAVDPVELLRAVVSPVTNKKTARKGSWGYGSVVEHMSGMGDALFHSHYKRLKHIGIRGF